MKKTFNSLLSFFRGLFRKKTIKFQASISIPRKIETLYIPVTPGTPEDGILYKLECTSEPSSHPPVRGGICKVHEKFVEDIRK